MAVAANFLTTAEALAAGFSAETGHAITLAHGSSGRLYAQIVHGAPFDLFLSADRARPDRLIEAGLAAEVRSYATGRLVLLSRNPAPELPGDIVGARIAIANALIAPYGAAAEEVLAGWGITERNATILRGDSVGQAASLLATGNTGFALVSAAQAGDVDTAYLTPLPTTAHAPIVQDAVLLLRGAGNPVAQAFYDYLASPGARRTIQEAGYDLPPEGAGHSAGLIAQ